jgi:ribose transport system permease protein
MTTPELANPQIPVEREGSALRSAYRRAGPYFVRYGTLVAFAAVVLAFSLARPNTFATWENWKSILNLGSVVFVMALVLTVPMIMGDFDLSIGYNVQLLGAFAIVAVAHWSLNVGLGIFLTFVLGATIGAIIGAVVAWSKVSAFVITLGAGTAMLGIELRLTHNGENIYSGIPTGYLNIANKTFLSLPLPVWITFAILIVLWFVTEHSVLGRYMAAIGGNMEAARLSGVNVEIVRTIGFVIVGLGAAVGGIIVTAQAQEYFANAATGNLLPAYAGVFLGAATLRPGQFHVIGTYIGVLFMQTIQTGLIIMNYPAYTADIIQGLVLVVAVLLSRLGGGAR